MTTEEWRLFNVKVARARPLAFASADSVEHLGSSAPFPRRSLALTSDNKNVHKMAAEEPHSD